MNNYSRLLLVCVFTECSCCGRLIYSVLGGVLGGSGVSLLGLLKTPHRPVSQPSLQR